MLLAVANCVVSRSVVVTANLFVQETMRSTVPKPLKEPTIANVVLNINSDKVCVKSDMDSDRTAAPTTECMIALLDTLGHAVLRGVGNGTNDALPGMQSLATS